MTSQQHTSLLFPLMSLLKYPYMSRHAYTRIQTHTHADTRRHTQTHADTRRHQATQTHIDKACNVPHWSSSNPIIQTQVICTYNFLFYIFNKKLYVYSLITKKIFEFLSAGLILDSIRFVSKEWHQYPIRMKKERRREGEKERKWSTQMEVWRDSFYQNQRHYGDPSLNSTRTPDASPKQVIDHLSSLVASDGTKTNNRDGDHAGRLISRAKRWQRIRCFLLQSLGNVH